MSRMLVRRAMMAGVALAIVGVVVAVAMPLNAAGIGVRRIDPAQVVPIDQLVPELRDSVVEVIRDHTFHRQGEPDTFPCPPDLYLSLVNEPAMTVALWKDLSDTPVRLQKVTANRYEGDDGSGSKAIWEFALRSPRQHVLLAHFNYVSPHGNARVEARIVVVVNSAYYHDRNKTPFVQHNVDIYVKVDSKGWKTVARTVRPVVERILEEQVKEAGYFVSLMSKLVLSFPNWATGVVGRDPGIDAATQQQFATIVAQHRRPGASTGRPVVRKDSSNITAETRRR
ncbi:MAG: hypothetical protein ACYC61_03810 [Isosphaeraceae bacterium]